jgi:hypothetical protein
LGVKKTRCKAVDTHSGLLMVEGGTDFAAEAKRGTSKSSIALIVVDVVCELRAR